MADRPAAFTLRGSGGPIRVTINADLWWIETTAARGPVFVVDGRVVGGAPVFRHLIGRRVTELSKDYVLVMIPVDDGPIHS